MCGRFALYSPMKEVAERVQAHTGLRLAFEDQPPRYNVAPGTGNANVTHVPDWSIRLFQWGFQPSWWKEGNPKPINARAEKVASSPMFRRAFARARTLIPANGYYEWRPDGAGVRQPYYIHPEDEPLLMFAGIASVPEDPELTPSCAIITEPARGPLKQIHDRMPVALNPDCWKAWLDPELTDREAVRDFLLRFDPDRYEVYPVSRAVNRPSNDQPDVIEPLASA